ncbi:porin family protein [Shewanella fidelis]|uniref:Porin family protein n=1 Tax=Shewanella fidelis TaxID=173509 RepID=A0AAW8NHM2_9GAMM|nr:porin family protein [Shewanella fidelis]MDR8522848.1 porin family protein [Shewanella fidelis]MDW4811826.1 porin family protein [Shewanella fidelis]MDW4818106.1 porin family protein [Shewanella fidelis]MDW4822173.1 porin family protein [Shewanella fidelis]MDW4826390.1 porin family protein [Shewanella fidelis]
MRILSVLVAGLLSCNAMAVQGDHIMGANVGFGHQDFEGSSSDSSTSGDNMMYDIYYRYMWQDNFGVEAGYLSGSGGIVSAFVGIIAKVNNIEYNGFRTALYGEYMLSPSNRLYAKLGASANELSYDLEASNNNVKSISDRDVDLFSAVGWGIRFNSGLGMNIEYQYIPIQQLTVQNLSIGMSYRF